MDLKEKRERVDLISLTQNRVHWQKFMKTI